MGRGEGVLTHGNEHDDRQGVVHGVSAHGPPCQTDHLPSKGPLASPAGETGYGGTQLGGCPIAPRPLQLQTHALGAHLNCPPGPQRVWLLQAPHSLGHIWGQRTVGSHS